MNFNKKQFLNVVLFYLIFSVLLSSSNSWSQDRVRIALWGDSRENYLGACENVTDYLLHEDTDWDFQVHTGDFSSRGSEEDWQKSLNYAGMDSIFFAGKFFMCTSNHDANRSTWDKYTAGVLPLNSADSTTHFYHYQKGNVHLIACDGYFTNSAVMNDWLDQELAKIPQQDWLIGVWHNPCYGDVTYKSSYLGVCSPWLEKFYAHGGDFILHGHAHTYVRSHPLLPDGSVDFESGMVHIVNGCGGASFKSPQQVVEKTAYTPTIRSFACITFLTLEGNIASIKTVDVRKLINYGVIDEWTWDRTTKVAQKATPFVKEYSLKPNYPNPFNPTTKISYSLAKSGHVTLAVYDILGREVAMLVNENQNAGIYAFKFKGVDNNGNILPSGVYLCRYQSGSYVHFNKMLLMR